MKKYEIQITETLQRIVVVKACNRTVALDMVEDDYKAGKIVLDASDYMDSDFEEVT